MRIGVMLRAYDEKGGVGVYTQNIVAELLRIDRDNDYVLLFRSRENMGRFAGHPNVSERLLRPSNKVLWDQVAVPRACRREKIDVLFHPKFTVPLLAPCPAAMVVHGADWFMPDQSGFYPWLDVRYVRAVMPLYFRKCAAVISVSRLTTENFNAVLDLPADKVRTVYFGPARHFHRVADPAALDEVRRRHDLPEQFIFTLTKLSADSRKNTGGIFEAYRRYHAVAARPTKLVVGGKDCHRLRARYGIPDDGWGRDILFPGWIDQRDLPAVYTLATLYLYPSNLEAFPIPITEALACGTPIVTSNVNGLEELAADAALLVDPADADAIAGAVREVLEDPELRQSLSAKGLERSRLFSWEKCARETLEILTEIGGGRDVN